MRLRGPHTIRNSLPLLVYGAVGAGPLTDAMSSISGGKDYIHGLSGVGGSSGGISPSTRLGSGAGKATDTTGGSRMTKASGFPARPAPPLLELNGRTGSGPARTPNLRGASGISKDPNETPSSKIKLFRPSLQPLLSYV